MPIAKVLYNGILAGKLEKSGDGQFMFTYDAGYLSKLSLPPISLTLPRQAQSFISKEMFSFFSGLLTEGVNKDIQCRLLKLDEKDDFTRLL